MARYPLILLALAALIFAACAVGDEPSPTAVVTETPTATSTPVVTATSRTTASPTLTAAATSMGASVVTGLFVEPREIVVDATASVPDPPEAPFPSHDRMNTVLYDFLDGEALDLGPGHEGVFSPDERYMAWAASGTAEALQVLDLETGETRNLGAGTRAIQFVNDTEVLVRLPGGNEDEVVDVETGERGPAPAGSVEAAQLIGDLQLASLPRMGGEPQVWEVSELEGNVLLRFEATNAVLISEETLLLATSIVDGTSNVFFVEVASGEAEFVATVYVAPNPAPAGQPGVPLSGNDDHVLWIDNYCVDTEPRRTLILERATGTITAYEPVFWGRLAEHTPTMIVGEFGDRGALNFDGEWQAVLPEGSVDVNWSPSLRYASRGLPLGHGGQCPT